VAATYGRGAYELKLPAPDFALGGGNASQAIEPGQSAAFPVELQGTNGFNQTVSPSSTVSPADPGVSVSMSQSSATPGTTVTVTVAASAGAGMGSYTVTVRGVAGSLSHNAISTVTEANGPTINSAVFDGHKTLTIAGSKFGPSPKVLINGVDRKVWTSDSSDTSITLKGKPKKIGIVPGTNTVQISDASGNASPVFTFVGGLLE